MSKLWTPAPYKNKCMELQITNCVIHCHDLGCGCKDPLLHTLQLLLQGKIDSTIPEPTKQKILCLLSEDAGFKDTDTNHTTGNNEEEDLDIDAGDLEQLFSENFEDDER